MGNRIHSSAGALLAAGFVLSLAGCSGEVKTGGAGNSSKTAATATTLTDPAKATASVTFNVTGMT